MSSDESTRKGLTYARPIGPGSLVTFRCDGCGNPRTTAGRQMKRKGPSLRLYYCRKCVAK